MTYTLTLDGLALHHYGQGVYGWGPTSSTTGQPGRRVEWTMRTEAESWMQARAVFCAGAQVQAMSAVQDARAAAEAWRARWPGHAGGVVLVWAGAGYGWKNCLRDAGHERPGALAVDADGNVYRAEGGNDLDGASVWVVV